MIALMLGIVAAAAASMLAAHHRGLSLTAATEKAMRRIGHVAALALSSSGIVHAQAPAGAPPQVRPAVIGINPAPLGYSGTTAPFANLAIGTEWNDTSWKPLGPEHLDRNGDLVSMPPDGKVTRFLIMPPTGPAGIDVRCTFTGNGTLTMSGSHKPVQIGSHSITFNYVKEQVVGYPWLNLTDFDPKHPLRDLDCRQVGQDRSVRFRPEALAPLRGMTVVRFMDWQNANGNKAVAWARRTTPAAIQFGNDGVAIEDMLAFANELGADPWFVMPWNADDDYIRHFAQMVRTALPPGRSVYVETGNEVWNTGFPVGQQATREGVARHLATDPRDANTRRYAQRTVEVMRIWEAVFAGRKGLVRVLATQQVDPSMGELAISFADTAQHVDAMSTSAYFGDTVGGTGSTRDSGVAVMETSYGLLLGQLAASRRIAAAHGKRFVAYEGGPGLVLPAQPDLMARIQHDPALYPLMRRFLDQWAAGGGDVLCLYNSIFPPGPWGMWGLAAWENDTPDQAPKMHAVHDFIAGQRAAGVAATQPIAR